MGNKSDVMELLTLTCGVLLSLVGFTYVYVTENQVEKKLFLIQANLYYARVEKVMIDAVLVAETLNNACGKFDAIAPLEFHKFASRLKAAYGAVAAVGCRRERAPRAHIPSPLAEKEGAVAQAVMNVDMSVPTGAPAVHALWAPLQDASLEHGARSGTIASSKVFPLSLERGSNVGVRIVTPPQAGAVAALVIRPDVLFKIAEPVSRAAQELPLEWMAYNAQRRPQAGVLYSAAHSAKASATAQRWCVFDCRPAPLSQTFNWAGTRWTVELSSKHKPFFVLHDGALKLLLAGLLASVGAALLVRSQQTRTDWLVDLAIRRTAQLKSLNAVLLGDIEARKLLEDELNRSQQELRDLAAHDARVKEDERKRIAREIHDDLGQGMLALRMDLARLANGDSQAITPERIGGALLQIDSMMAAMRMIINELRPVALDLGLDVAIEWEVAKFHRRTGIICHLDVKHDSYPFSDDIATALYRIVQESMTNIMRHAKATHVEVALWMESGWVFLTIADNGIGISEQCRRKAKSFGLIGIAERIDALGGAFDTKSIPGTGTKLTIAVPFAPLPQLDAPCIML